MPARQTSQQRPTTGEPSDTIPPTDWIPVTLRLRPDLHERLKEVSEATGRSRNNLINQAVEFAMTPPGGATRIAAQRRKITMQGDNGEQAWAAVAYILAYLGFLSDAERAWPWSGKFFAEPAGFLIENLVKAGGYIAAEIDRFQEGISPA